MAAVAVAVVEQRFASFVGSGLGWFLADTAGASSGWIGRLGCGCHSLLGIVDCCRTADAGSTVAAVVVVVVQVEDEGLCRENHIHKALCR